MLGSVFRRGIDTDFLLKMPYSCAFHFLYWDRYKIR